MLKHLTISINKLALNFVVMFFSITTFAQNLVPNPSFETVDCQSGFFLPWGCTVDNNAPWIAATLGSPDSFNACHSASFGMYNTPENYIGSQLAQEGNGYAGIFTYSEEQGNSEYREYISVNLTDDLIAGTEYIVSYYCSLSDKSQLATKPPALYFSNSSISDFGHSNALNQYAPQIAPQNIISDSINWTLISEVYTAVGGERNITIGNFNTDANTSSITTNLNAQFTRAYYYIDQVSVEEYNPYPTASFQLSSNSTCEGNCITINDNSSNATGTQITSWNWTVTPTIGAPNIDNVQNPGVVCWNTPGTYDITLTVSNGQSYDDTTVQFIVYEEIQLDLGADTVICSENHVLDAGNTGATFLWHDGSTSQLFNATETGVHYVTVSNGACIETREIYLEFSPLDINLGQQLLVCEENLAQGVLLDAGNSGANYLWNTGSTDQQITINLPGTYSVTITDTNNFCSVTDSIKVFEQIIDLNFSTIDTAGCIDLTASFENNSNLNIGTIDSWNWNFGDGNNSTIENPTHTYTAVGDFDVTLSVLSDIGCQADTTFENYIHTYPWAIANFSYTSGDIIVSSEVNFNNLSSNSDSWIWDFNSEAVSTEENPSYTFDNAGNFDVTLIAQNTHGCNDTITKPIVINDNITLFAPNAFTPDGNLINDEWSFSIFGVDKSNFSVMVFDRWGELIWESTDTEASWDGTYKGALVQDGTYTWVINCSARINAEKKLFKGFIQVIR